MPHSQALDITDHEAVKRDGRRGPRRPRQHGRRHERRRDLHLGDGREPRAPALEADDRRQPDRPDQRHRGLRAADDRGRPRRARRQRLLGRGAPRLALARRLQRQQVRPARRLRGAALRSPPARHRRQPGLPGRRWRRRWWGPYEIVGIDGEDPRCSGCSHRFERHAVSPEHVAEKIVSGIEKNRYMVFTSADVRLALAPAQVRAALRAGACAWPASELDQVADSRASPVL